MRKTLKKGFTLIELMVVIAIIGILATTLAPKLREQLAKAKDSKAISLLGASRTVAGALIIDGTINDSGNDKVYISGEGILKQLDVKEDGLIKDSAGAASTITQPTNLASGTVIIGGSRENDGVTYGGSVALNIARTTGGTTTTGSYVLLGSATTRGLDIDSANDLHLAPTVDVKSKSTEKKSWFAY